MERTITVRGTGTLRRKPDWIEISMTLKSLDRDYAKSAEKSAEQLSALRRALENAGFPADTLKTASFRIDAEQEGQQDADGRYRNVFAGFACVHELKLGFPFETGKLAQAIDAITYCVADPELSVNFTIHDWEKAADELLVSAAANARKKAETLTRAAGVTLGELLSMDYSCRETDFYSPTGLRMGKRGAVRATVMDLAIAPEDVELGDSADFIWSIR